MFQRRYITAGRKLVPRVQNLRAAADEILHITCDDN